MAKTATRTPAVTLSDECCTPSLLTAPLDTTAAVDLAAAFGALADPVRLRCLSLIATAGECCSCDLEGPLRRSQPTVSHHLKVLREAGWVSSERRGTWIWYRLRPEAVSRFGGILGLTASAATTGANASRALPVLQGT